MTSVSSPFQSSSRLTRTVASLCIFTQILFPVATTASHPTTERNTTPAAVEDFLTPVVSGAALNAPPQEDNAARVAAAASQAGGMLQSGMNSRQAADMARGYVTGTAQSAFQKWLSQWGTARVTLGMDGDFSLKASSFDLLLPWHDTPENLLFTQHSFHRTDDRNQFNTGAGWRHFAPDYMAGVNLFFDHDLTRYHSRMGLGGEYWRDNLKLAANGYLRLSGWRDAPELDYDYEARPANGWDVRAEGYLPAYPQLGATLMYEQYYGDEVALFGKDSRQQDPHAFTAGLSYTPVPLVSLSAEQKQGKGGGNDTRFALNLTYTPGVSLARQLDPDAVAYRRSLAGSRHDLVERNNNIVLEYRKKELVKLQLHDPVTGKGGEQKLLVASLQSKYALKTLRAEAAELQSAGGVVNTEANQVTVTLPEYRYTATPETDNVYRVAVTAEDEKGNHSNREESTVVVLAPQLSPESSQVTSDKTTLKPDGAEKAVLTFRAQDAEGKAVSALTVSASFTAPQGMTPVLSDTFTETQTKGTYTAELKGTMPGEVHVMPQVDGKDAAKEAVTVTLVATTPVSEHSSIALSSADSGAVRAGQAFRAGDAVIATVVLRDEQQRPVIHQAALLNEESVTVSGMEPAAGAAWQEEDDGIYRMAYTAKNARDAHKATLRLADGSKSTEPYTIHPGELKAAHSPLSIDKTHIRANGTETATLQWLAHDAHNNAISNLQVKPVAKLKDGMNITLSDDFSETEPGSYSATISGTSQGEVEIMVYENDRPAADQPVKVELLAGQAVMADSTIDVARAQYRAGDDIVVTVKLKDEFSNPLLGKLDLLNSAKLEMTNTQPLPGPGWDETEDGKYERIYQAPNVGAGLKAELTVSDGVISSGAYLITAGEVNAAESSLRADPLAIEANNTEASTLTYTAMDTWKNPVGDLDTSNLKLSVKGLEGTDFSGFTAGSAGIYTGTLKGAKTGKAFLMPVMGDKALAKEEIEINLTDPQAANNHSSIAIAKAGNIRAGDRIEVTVTLKDKDDVPVANMGAKLLESGVVEVPGMEPENDQPWQNGESGTWTRGYIAHHAREESRTARLNMPGWQQWSEAYTITPGTVEASASTLTADKKVIIANDHDAAPLIYTAQDAFGNRVSGMDNNTLTLRISGLEAKDTAFSEFTDTGNGVYTGTLTGTASGHVTLMPLVAGNDAASTHLEVELIAGDVDPQESGLSVNKERITADGSDSATLILTLRDAHSNLVTGLKEGDVVFTQVGAEPTDLTIFDLNYAASDKGEYTAQVRGLKTGEATIQATALGITVNDNVQIILVNGAVDPTNSDLSVSESSITANGSKTAKLTLTLRDANNNLVTGQEKDVAFAETVPGTLSLQFSETSYDDRASGKYTAMTGGIKAGETAVQATVEGMAVANPVSMVLTPDSVDPAHSSLSVAPEAITANGNKDATLTLTLRDVHDNLVTGLANDIAFEQAGTALASLSIDDVVADASHKGQYTAKVGGTTTGEASIQGRVKNIVVATPVSLRLLHGLVDPDKSILEVVNGTIEANGDEKATLTLTLRDAHNNLLTGLTEGVLFEQVGAEPADLTIDDTQMYADNAKGEYRVTVSGIHSGTANIQAKFNTTLIADTKINLQAGAPVADTSTLEIENDTIEANGVEKATLTLWLRDVHDNLVTGLTEGVLFEQVGAEPTDLNIDATELYADNAKGEYRVAVSGIHSGTAEIQASFKETQMLSPVQVKLNPGSMVPANSEMTVIPDNMAADNIATTTVTFKARDAHNNPVPGLASSLGLQLSNPLGISLGDFVENDNPGEYTQILTAGREVGATTLTPLYHSTAAVTESKDLTLREHLPVFENSTIAIVGGNYVAGSAMLVTVKLAGENGAPVINQAGKIAGAVTIDGAEPGTWEEQESTPGTYQATYVAPKKVTTGQKTAILQFADWTEQQTSGSYQIVAGPQSPEHSYLEAEKPILFADERNEVTLTFHALDEFDNPVVGLKSMTLSVTGITGNYKFAGFSTNGRTDGTYTGQISATGEGNVTLTPLLNGEPLVTEKNAGKLEIRRFTVTSFQVDPNAEFIVSDEGVYTDLWAKIDTIYEGVTVRINPPDGVTVYASERKTNAEGYAFFPARTSIAGTYKFKTWVGVSTKQTTLEVNIKPAALDEAASTLQTTESEILANDSQTATLTFTAKDRFNNLITDLTDVKFSLTGLKEGTYTLTPQPNAGVDGLYKATLKGYEVGSAKVTVTSGSIKKDITVKLNYGPFAPQNTEISISNPQYAGSAINLKIFLRDVYGHNIKGKLAELKNSLQIPMDVEVINELAEQANGAYTAKYIALFNSDESASNRTFTIPQGFMGASRAMTDTFTKPSRKKYKAAEVADLKTLSYDSRNVVSATDCGTVAQPTCDIIWSNFTGVRYDFRMDVAAYLDAETATVTKQKVVEGVGKKMFVYDGATFTVKQPTESQGRVSYKFQDITPDYFGIHVRPKTGTKTAATTANMTVLERVLPEVEMETIVGTKLAMSNQTNDYTTIRNSCTVKGYDIPTIDFLVRLFTQYERNGLASDLTYVWSSSLDGDSHKVLNPVTMKISLSPSYVDQPYAFMCIKDVD